MYSPDGVPVTFPDGTMSATIEGVQQTRLGILSMPKEVTEEKDPPARVYWMLLAWGTQGQGILSMYMAWKPWIDQHGPYMPPPDPLHVTFHYTREPDKTC